MISFKRFISQPLRPSHEHAAKLLNVHIRKARFPSPNANSLTNANMRRENFPLICIESAVQTPFSGNNSMKVTTNFDESEHEPQHLKFAKDFLLQSSLNPAQACPAALQSVLDAIEIFEHYDGSGDDFSECGQYFTRGQRRMMDKLIQQIDGSEEEKMNAVYMVDLGDVIRQHVEWITLLPRIHPFYAIKCNPDPMIIRLLNYLGCSFDCASKNEMDLLIKNGVDVRRENNGHDKVIFSHPCKHPLHLKYASQIGVNLCTFDNEYEIAKIDEHHRNTKSLLRIQVDDSQSICKFNTKYGFDIDNMSDVYDMFDLCRKHSLNLSGIMFHVGSGCLDSNVYRTAIERSRMLFEVAHSRFGYDEKEMNILDMGGGFPGINDTHSIHFRQIAQVINDALDYYFAADEHKYQLIAEPGRYFVSKSHSLICDIIAKKRHRDGDAFMYYINDGMYGSFNCMYFDHAYPVIMPYNKEPNAAKYKSTIFGPTCDSMDKMYDGYLLPQMDVGNKLIIPNFGAYTGAAATPFNGFLQSKSKYVMTL